MEGHVLEISSALRNKFNSTAKHSEHPGEITALCILSDRLISWTGSGFIGWQKLDLAQLRLQIPLLWEGAV